MIKCSCDIPEHTRAGLDNYIFQGIPPGGFVMAILSDKLVESFLCADETNLMYMHEIAGHLYNCVPMKTRGSKERVIKWLEARRLERENKETEV